MKLLLKLILVSQLIPTNLIYAERRASSNGCNCTVFTGGLASLITGICLLANGYDLSGTICTSIGGVIIGGYAVVITCACGCLCCSACLDSQNTTSVRQINERQRIEETNRRTLDQIATTRQTLSDLERALPAILAQPAIVTTSGITSYGTNGEQQNISCHPNATRTENALTTLNDIQRMEQGRARSTQASSSSTQTAIVSSVQQPIQPLQVRALNYSNPTCAICTEVMAMDKNGGIAMPPFKCQHITCVDCAQNWIKTKGTQAKCPMCRAALR